MCEYYIDIYKAGVLQYRPGSSSKVILKQAYNFGVLGELAKLQSLKKEYHPRSCRADINKIKEVATEIFQNYGSQLNWLSKLVYKVAKFFHIPTTYSKIERIYLDIIHYEAS